MSSPGAAYLNFLSMALTPAKEEALAPSGAARVPAAAAASQPSVTGGGGSGGTQRLQAQSSLPVPSGERTVPCLSFVVAQPTAPSTHGAATHL